MHRRTPRLFQQGTDVEPLAILSLHPVRGTFWSPEILGIDFQLWCRGAVPGRNDRVDDSPREFHFVAASEQTCVAVESVQQKSLIRIGHLPGEFALEREVEIGELKTHA